MHLQSYFCRNKQPYKGPETLIPKPQSFKVLISSYGQPCKAPESLIPKPHTLNPKTLKPQSLNPKPSKTARRHVLDGLAQREANLLSLQADSLQTEAEFWWLYLRLGPF